MKLSREDARTIFTLLCNRAWLRPEAHAQVEAAFVGAMEHAFEAGRIAGLLEAKEGGGPCTTSR